MTTKTDNKNNLFSWQIISVFLVLFFGGVGFAATAMLLRLPTNNSCNNLSLLFSSATNRLYCAQLRAEEDTVEGFLGAIDLISNLPEDHPLISEVDRYITTWSDRILAIAQEKYHQGELEEAIAIAEKIPTREANEDLISQKIEEWQSVWEEGESIVADIEEKLRRGQWNQAFLATVQLLELDNAYWSSTQYDEMVQTITLAQEESSELDEAFASINRGGIDNLIKTIEIASRISKSSFSYDRATELARDAEGQIIDIVKDLIDDRNWAEVSTIARQIPRSSPIRDKADDWSNLASAGRNANLNTVSGLNLAISQLDKISSSSGVYAETRKLKNRWTLQKEDLIYLTEAKDLAKPGNVDSLQQAIARAEFISNENPLHSEAQQEIRKWRREIQVKEDQPYLNRARELASRNTVSGWQEAIAQAQMIEANRALHSEARNLIAQWRGNIQRVEDQPTLDRAISLGSQNRYQEAINVASAIGSNRSLHSEAQSRIRTWRREITARQNFNEASQIAQNRDAQSLSRAITIARRIPSSTDVSAQGRNAVNSWSEQLLAIARRTNSLQEAINIADMIPSGTSAYNAARRDIQQWRARLAPPPAPRRTPTNPPNNVDPRNITPPNNDSDQESTPITPDTEISPEPTLEQTSF
ncbi:hypothetical protein A5482_010750 [Cyanobacterium sp. IPPAS B-1200]|uniref:hypothetical protein n=1 Tax=Cyanobacterium sp. IPPAS B-1200 TaxID=1562720 RepID=UPI0008527FE7|nr:hypothetical protein [Cyanobacterium sp. IPPAS B-1200]OEJ79755.1 hypothetical protein A5482_09060 [Cyanobacterium sp. IPPAS B-1200]